MTRLSQIIAVETAVASDAERRINEAKRELASPDRLSGLTKTYKPRDEEGEQLPGKSTKVQVKTEDVLAGVTAALERLFDVRLTKDAANASAAVDLKVGGRTLLEKVPVTYMLFLERELEKLAQLVAGLPLLDPAEEWSADEVSGCWRSESAVTDRSKKVPRTLVAYEATPQHPAQVQIWQEDVLAGLWTTVKFSGAVPADQASREKAPPPALPGRGRCQKHLRPRGGAARQLQPARLDPVSAPLVLTGPVANGSAMRGWGAEVQRGEGYQEGLTARGVNPLPTVSPGAYRCFREYLPVI